MASTASSAPSLDPRVRARIDRGVVLPAHPLALTSGRRLDERRQRALSRYYIAAGAGGLAVGVHTTQFAIRDPRWGLLEPVLELAAEEMDRADADRAAPLVRVAGAVGDTPQAVAEAETARRLGYHAALLGLGAFRERSEEAALDCVRQVASVLPVFGFYLNPAVGGRELPLGFWRRFFEIDGVVAVKIACFDRYRTLDVVRAAVETGRDDVALYTGNDDHIIGDLLTPYRLRAGDRQVERRIVGGLLGHWAVWTRRAVELHAACREAAREGRTPGGLFATGVEVTDMNAALFDAAHGFRGCIAGVLEVLRRQGLVESVVCLDEDEGLSPGQSAELDRVTAAYPHLTDDAFVREHRDRWLAG